MAQTVLFLSVGSVFGARIEGGVPASRSCWCSPPDGDRGERAGDRAGAAHRLGRGRAGTFPLFFALLFFSSAFFPRETMTGWFKTVADLNPISYLVEAMRDLVIEGVEPRPT